MKAVVRQRRSALYRLLRATENPVPAQARGRASIKPRAYGRPKYLPLTLADLSSNDPKRRARAERLLRKLTPRKPGPPRRAISHPIIARFVLDQLRIGWDLLGATGRRKTNETALFEGMRIVCAALGVVSSEHQMRREAAKLAKRVSDMRKVLPSSV